MITNKRPVSILLIIFIFTLSFSAQLTLTGINGSSVYVNKVFSGIINDSLITLNLLPDDTVEVKKNGYSDFSFKYDGISQNYSSLQVPMAKVIITVNTDNVYADYIFSGNNYSEKILNNSVLNIPYTVKSINFRSEGFIENNIEVNLKPFSESTLDVILYSSDSVYFYSDYKNVYAQIGNEKINLPAYINVEKTDKIDFYSDGYIKKTVDTENIKLNKSFKVDMTESTEVFIDSNVKSATVLIDGEISGFTPFQTELSEGKHQITLKKTGYDEKEIIADIKKDGYNRYTVELNEKNKIVQLLNSQDYEVNIDGVYIGKNINKIIFDNKDHILRFKKGSDVTEIFYTKDFKFSEIDLSKITVINVFGEKNKKAFFQNDKINLSGQFLFHQFIERTVNSIITSEGNFVVNSLKNKTENVFVNPDKAYISVASNNDKTLFYADGVFIGSQNIFGYMLSEGNHQIKAVFNNVVKTKNINLVKSEYKLLSFDFDNKVPVRYTDNIYFENSEGKKLVYVKNGPNAFEYMNKKYVVFINNADFISENDLQ